MKSPLLLLSSIGLFALLNVFSCRPYSNPFNLGSDQLDTIWYREDNEQGRLIREGKVLLNGTDSVQLWHKEYYNDSRHNIKLFCYDSTCTMYDTMGIRRLVYEFKGRNLHGNYIHLKPNGDTIKKAIYFMNRPVYLYIYKDNQVVHEMKIDSNTAQQVQ